jgi:excisionase family DNA binding protein
MLLAGMQELRAIKAELKKHTETTPTLEHLLDAKEVAELLGETKRWVSDHAKQEQLPGFKDGKCWKFRPSQLQKWLEDKNNG